MKKVTKAKPHLNVEEIDEKIKLTVGFWRVQRWLVIRHALVDPKPAKEIGLHVGLARQTVHNIVSRYNRYGCKAIETKGRGMRQRAYLKLKEEEEFLSEFNYDAALGRVTTANDIKIALEKRLGHKVHISTIHRMLKRHGWRKLQPRPRHVKSDAAEQDAFKKTLHRK